jgi:hypothetical protein
LDLPASGLCGILWMTALHNVGKRKVSDTKKVWSFAKGKTLKKSIEFIKTKKGNEEQSLLFGKIPKQFHQRWNCYFA